jgi:hypothetical protein
MAEWWSIEVFHGEKEPATRWQESYLDALTEAAVTNGALYWEWSEQSYGVIFEVCFADEEQWEAFRNLPAVKGALDAVPDPVNGLLVYRGRGGAAGGRKPRKPKPAPGAAALELEEPRKRKRIRLGSGGFGHRERGPAAPDPAPEPVPDLTPGTVPEVTPTILPDRHSAARG